MTSIYDIPYEDITIFLLANNKNFNDKNNAYNKMSKLIKNERAIGHTLNIIEWMIAYNLLQNNINIPTYTSYQLDKMSQKHIIELSKLLTLNEPNIDHIKNILRYMNKLDENININNNQNLTLAGEAIYNIILSNMENKTINKMTINKYSKLYLEDQNFWKNRLMEIFRLKTNDENFDYKFAVQFLDNSKSLNDNYFEAMSKGYKSIIKLLLNNDKVDKIEPYNILDKIKINLSKLGNIKNLHYNNFIKEVIKETNSLAIIEDDEINIDYFDKIDFTGDKLDIIIDIDDITGENISNRIHSDINNLEIMTNGEILYKISQLIPNDNEIRNIYINHIENNSYFILTQIENHRFNENLEDLSKDFLVNLIQSPEDFLDFLNENTKNLLDSIFNPKCNKNKKPYYNFLPDYTNYFGNYNEFRGLYKFGDGDSYIATLEA